MSLGASLFRRTVQSLSKARRDQGSNACGGSRGSCHLQCHIVPTLLSVSINFSGTGAPMKLKFIAVWFVLNAMALSQLASAQVEVQGSPGLGTVSVPAIVTVNPNNDNVPAAGVGDNNIFVPIKRFDHNGNIDIEFHVAPSQGVTEYSVFESVDNNTGSN
jgi:hypothetical protein